MADQGILVARVEAALQGPCKGEEGTEVVAACSGGADSVFLVHALSSLGERWPLACVLFVDHGLRDVSAESRASRRAAEAVGVPWRSLPVALPTRGNVQANARDARLQALLQATPPGAMLATGHTQDDQAETVLQRLIRGSGLRGLSGIAHRKGRVIRPMLEITREETRSAGLAFEDDPSNDTDAYQRNRIRREALPLLEQEHPGAKGHLARLATQASEELALIDRLLDGEGSSEGGLIGVPVEEASAWARWRARRDLPPGLRPSRAALEAVGAHLASGALEKATSLGGGWRAVAHEGQLRFEPETDLRHQLVLPAPGSYSQGALRVHLLPGADAESVRGGPAGLEAWLDDTDLKWPLTLKRESEGDTHDTMGPNRPWSLWDASGEALWRSSQPPGRQAGGLYWRVEIAL